MPGLLAPIVRLSSEPLSGDHSVVDISRFPVVRNLTAHAFFNTDVLTAISEHGLE